MASQVHLSPAQKKLLGQLDAGERLFTRDGHLLVTHRGDAPRPVHHGVYNALVLAGCLSGYALTERGRRVPAATLR